MKNKSIKNFFTLLVLRYNVILVILIIIIVFVAGWFLLLQRPYNAISQAGSLNVEKKQIELDSNKQELLSLKKLEEQFNSISSAERQYLLSVLPELGDLSNIYQQIEELSGSLNIDLKGININPQTSSKEDSNKDLKSLQQVMVNVSFEGVDSYPEVINFLQGVEKNIRVLDLATFSYSNSQDSYVLSFKTYYIN